MIPTHSFTNLPEYHQAVEREAATLGIKNLTARDRRVIGECFVNKVTVLSCASVLRPNVHNEIMPSTVQAETQRIVDDAIVEGKS